MLSINISDIAYALVHQELIGKGVEDEALYLHVDARLSYCENPSVNRAEVFIESRGIHVLYHCPRRNGYVTVFTAVTDSPFARIDEVKDWKHETSHDSCWRDIGIFNRVYFEMADGINANLKTKVAPRVMDQACYLSPRGLLKDALFSWVKVEVIKDPTDSSNYRKLLRLLE